MNIIVYSLLLLLVGCAAPQAVHIATNNMGKISELPQPTQPIVQPLVKPSVRV